SVPWGSSWSACQAETTGAPACLRARATSPSRLEPGKVMTAAFIASLRKLDAVVLDDGVGEQALAGLAQHALGLGPVRRRQLDVEDLALADRADALDAEGLQPPLDGLALRVEHASLEGHGHAGFHGRGLRREQWKRGPTGPRLIKIALCGNFSCRHCTRRGPPWPGRSFSVRMPRRRATSE